MSRFPRLAGLALAALVSLAPLAAQAQAQLASESCLGCHGPGGAGAGSIPGIAGRDAAELRTMLMAFRANEKPGSIMGRVTRGFTEAELAAVAEHFSRLKR